jgi:hypothetical protein
MSVVVEPPVSGDLAITFSAEIDAPECMALVRVTVDGQALDEYGITYGQLYAGGTRSYTFVADDVAAGTHTVVVEWSIWPSGTAWVSDRTLSVVASPLRDTDGSVIGVTGTTDLPPVTWSDWAPDPDLALDFVATTSRDIAVTVSATGWATGGWVFTRVLVDGVALGPIGGQVAFMGTLGVRANTFTFTGAVAAGQHHVEVQWLATGATGTIIDRSLVVVSAPGEPGSGILGVTCEESAFLSLDTNGAWAARPELALTVQTPAAGALAITVSMDLTLTGGRVFLRALLDGVPVSPSDVAYALDEQNSEFTCTAFTFIASHVSAGTHVVQIEVRTDPGIPIALYDRSLVVYGWPGT